MSNLASISVDKNPIDALIAAIECDGLTPNLDSPEYRYASLPLCVIDAVFSIGVRYSSVQATVERFCKKTGWRIERRNARSKGEYKVSDFLDLQEGREGIDLAENLFGNRQRTSSKNGILKAEACFLFAKALKASGIEDFDDIFDERKLAAEALILGQPGQGSGIAFDYFLILAGDKTMVKPDRHVQNYVAKATTGNFRSTVSIRQTTLLVKAAAIRLAQTNSNWSASALDNAIWRKESFQDTSVTS